MGKKVGSGDGTISNGTISSSFPKFYDNGPRGYPHHTWRRLTITSVEEYDRIWCWRDLIRDYRDYVEGKVLDLKKSVKVQRQKVKWGWGNPLKEGAAT